jgi:hypothetical protein
MNNVFPVSHMHPGGLVRARNRTSATFAPPAAYSRSACGDVGDVSRQATVLATRSDLTNGTKCADVNQESLSCAVIHPIMGTTTHEVSIDLTGAWRMTGIRQYGRPSRRIAPTLRRTRCAALGPGGTCARAVSATIAWPGTAKSRQLFSDYFHPQGLGPPKTDGTVGSSGA